jgi:hypothetical protein
MELLVLDTDKHWFSVILRPRFWWRLKYLFKPHDLVFCASDDSWFVDGFYNETYLACGGVPDRLRHRT